MIHGIDYLSKMYPNFDEKSYQPDGIDLRLGQVYELEFEYGEIYGISDDQKKLPKHKPIAPEVHSMGLGWLLKPHSSYILEVDRPIHINLDSAQFYLPRSSLLRMGFNVATALGDSDFNGKLSFLGINETDNSLFLGKNVRFAQLIDFKVDGAGLYDGDYQEKIDTDWLGKDRIQF